MASSRSSGPILEGVFAINKPPAISSAQVIRDVQAHFDPSKLFKPWLDREHTKRDAEGHNQKQKRRWRGRRANNVKMGHGGTLDPMATGVLILGVGSGTKQLHHFTTECVKSYEATVLFGAATDTYDTEGKIVGRKPYDHITRDMVEQALGNFRGKGTQKPPIFSALRMQGKRLYEYAREGRELPEEIKERPVEVHELEMTEWFDGGTHDWHWPEREAEIEEKKFAGKILNFDGTSQETTLSEHDTTATATKRKRGDPLAESVAVAGTESQAKRQRADEESAALELIDGLQESAAPATAGTSAETTQTAQEDTFRQEQPESDRRPCPAPACKIRMTVTSGFYVRSLVHDLGAAVGSLGVMTSLIRTRQGNFKLGTNVLGYDELKQGEDVWGPKVKKMIEDWGDGGDQQVEERPAKANEVDEEKT